jgi:hypothetical protein
VLAVRLHTPVGYWLGLPAAALGPWLDTAEELFPPEK